MAKSKENFERRTYGRKIRIYDANLEVVDLWLGYLKKNSVWGVGVKANLYKQEPLSVTSDMNKFADGASTLTDVTATLDALSKENSNNPVAKRVLELLEDPAFAKHLSPEQLKEVQAKSESL
ncbi:unnamed protein product [Ambrosiozyma monospora]|uniref:Unnamed protein product n=1 Tax=Ambrosiozyma monospora TaxID=43982 RepID=A0ACB5TE28_AMBMO|nr:unnamed protein product [Ambrosiozyma monospora]